VKKSSLAFLVIAFLAVAASASDHTFNVFVPEGMPVVHETVVAGRCSVTMYKVGAVYTGDVYIFTNEGNVKSLITFIKGTLRKLWITRDEEKPNLIQECPLDSLPIPDEVKGLGCTPDPVPDLSSNDQSAIRTPSRFWWLSVFIDCICLFSIIILWKDLKYHF
jgi:hypothetical protein